MAARDQNPPGAAAAGSSPGTSSPGARPAGALFLRLKRAQHQPRREGGKGLFFYPSAKDQRPHKCSSVSDEAPAPPLFAGVDQGVTKSGCLRWWERT